MKHIFIGLLIGLVFACSVEAAPTLRTDVKTRCGWIANPTPANWWLTDKEAEWTISEQGGYQATGEGPPEFADAQWVKTNGPHGYGCGCITATFDHRTMRVLDIKSSKAKRLAQCRADKALKPAN